MYEVIRNIHSYWAFLVLIALLVAVINAFVSLARGKEFEARDIRLSLFALIFSHIQLLIGLVLYFVTPYFSAFSEQGMGAVMKDPTLRLYLVEHPFTNILAIVFITMGWSKHKKRVASNKKFNAIGVFYAIGLVALLSRIPWNTWLG
ncbi:hypothetical protein ABN763_06320 [Spongiivirga sp. MCCC 1A20706]|uniref:hypothetical protein n=1 Tax=Spongiivirga sp. MCCC 1A20706 TaxID=3160963 RepID=UPI003977BAB3